MLSSTRRKKISQFTNYKRNRHLLRNRTSSLGIPERERRDYEADYRTTAHHILHGTDTLQSLNKIRTTIQIYPEGFPNFEFIDPTTGDTFVSAYPSHRDYRLPRDTRIILQALEVAFRDPVTDNFEEE